MVEEKVRLSKSRSGIPAAQDSVGLLEPVMQMPQCKAWLGSIVASTLCANPMPTQINISVTERIRCQVCMRVNIYNVLNEGYNELVRYSISFRWRIQIKRHRRTHSAPRLSRQKIESKQSVQERGRQLACSSF